MLFLLPFCRWGSRGQVVWPKSQSEQVEGPRSWPGEWVPREAQGPLSSVSIMGSYWWRYWVLKDGPYKDSIIFVTNESTRVCVCVVEHRIIMNTWEFTRQRGALDIYQTLLWPHLLLSRLWPPRVVATSQNSVFIIPSSFIKKLFLSNICVYVMGWIVSSQNSNVEVPTPRTSECDYLEIKSL